MQIRVGSAPVMWPLTHADHSAFALIKTNTTAACFCMAARAGASSRCFNAMVRMTANFSVIIRREDEEEGPCRLQNRCLTDVVSSLLSKESQYVDVGQYLTSRFPKKGWKKSRYLTQICLTDDWSTQLSANQISSEDDDSITVCLQLVALHRSGLKKSSLGEKGPSQTE